MWRYLENTSKNKIPKRILPINKSFFLILSRYYSGKIKEICKAFRSGKKRKTASRTAVSSRAVKEDKNFTVVVLNSRAQGLRRKWRKKLRILRCFL